MKRTFIYILAFAIGVLPAFFIVFNSVFSDPSGVITERLFTLLLVILVYGILGYVFGRFIKERITLTLVISLPTIMLLILYLFKEFNTIGLSLVYLALTFGSTFLGTTLSKK